MKISRTTGYAVQATLQLAQAPAGQPIPCSKLASNGGMPERFLLQILRNLVTHGVLRSTRGVDGGYCLDKPAAETSLLEVIEAVEGPLTANVPGDNLPPEMSSRLHEALVKVNEQCRQHLAGVKLSAVIANGNATSNGRAASPSPATTSN
ncbi:MAG TPA: Rrf2 family transcriptional regulator [Pirellulales bacterium]|jgi:Rrf2 family protein|nr:Rrf2 family transcriptional regulator [Pirellulales bacterium]